jgi:hypothetical protein
VHSWHNCGALIVMLIRMQHHQALEIQLKKQILQLEQQVKGLEIQLMACKDLTKASNISDELRRYHGLATYQDLEKQLTQAKVCYYLCLWHCVTLCWSEF